MRHLRLSALIILAVIGVALASGLAFVGAHASASQPTAPTRLSASAMIDTLAHPSAPITGVLDGVSSVQPSSFLDDLRDMSLTRDDLGPQYGDLTLVIDEAIGPESVDPACAPVSAQALANSEWKGGYYRAYASPAGKEFADFSTPAGDGEFLWAASVLYLLGDETQASNVFSGFVADISPHVCGTTTWGGHQFDQFNPPAICDAAAGAVLSGSQAGHQWTHTEVMIRRGALVVRAAVGRYGVNFPSTSETIALAERLCTRIDSVAGGRKVIFIQGIDSASGGCGYTFRSEYSWMVDALLESTYVKEDVPSLDSSKDFFYFSYSGTYCPGAGGVHDYAKPQYDKSDTCVGVTDTATTQGGASKLEAMVTDLLARYPRARFDIVAHSMGGMVAAYWLSQHSIRADIVNSITTLDSPLRGTAQRNPFSKCSGTSNAWKNLLCDRWWKAGEDGNDDCESSIVWPIRDVANGGDPPDVPFYTIDATQQGVLWVAEEVPQDRTTLLASDSKAHCKFDDDHSSVWKNPDLGGDEPIACWDNFRWPHDLQTNPREPDVVHPSHREDVKGAFLACAIRGLSGSTCIRSLGETLIADATVDGSHAAGSTEVAISGGENLEVGDHVEINPGMPNEETRQVTSFGSLILDAPLEFDHEAGERIFRVDVASNPTPTPTVTPTPTSTVTPTPTATPTATPSAGTSGDTDCDEDVDAVDALNLLRNVAALPVSALCLASSGDIDCDDDIDAVDALGVLRHVALLPVNQPQGCAAIGNED